MRIRPLQPEEVETAREPGRATLPPPAGVDPAAADAYWAARFNRLVATDPGGCWAAEDDSGRIVGCALALVRDGIWGLSFLAVLPGVQGQGIGRLLIDAALTHAGGARGAIIASSTDPKAMRRYARAGFDLRPCVAAAGIVDRSALPRGLRSSEADAGALELAIPLGRAVRGGAYAPEDLNVYVQAGARVFRCGDDGLTVVSAGGPSIVLARDEATAADLLWAGLASSGNGATISVDFITAGQDWAIRTVLDAGLALSPDGPMFTRGDLGPLRPWIPAGTFL
jgi:GNAT superfamily N-acetyltransferase